MTPEELARKLHETFMKHDPYYHYNPFDEIGTDMQNMIINVSKELLTLYTVTPIDPDNDYLADEGQGALPETNADGKPYTITATIGKLS